MTAPVLVTEADREAAASGYFAWISGNPVMPAKMRAGTADDHSMVQAFARHRLAALDEAARAAWLAEALPIYPVEPGHRDAFRYGKDSARGAILALKAGA